MRQPIRIAFVLLTLGLLVYGGYLALAWAPPDREMGDVQRIMYVHVPAQWMALLAATLNFVCAVVYLFRPSWKADALAEASAEVALLFGGIGMVLGSIWGRPTWGVFWAWDPRLTTEAILLVAYAGYLALRRFVDDPERRAVWSSVVAIVIAADIPIVYFSVRWWKSLHQIQSSPSTVDPVHGAGAADQCVRLPRAPDHLPRRPVRHRPGGPRPGDAGTRGPGSKRGGGLMHAMHGVLAAVGEGRIQGGWEYVWAAYGIAWTALVLYALLCTVAVGAAAAGAGMTPVTRNRVIAVVALAVAGLGLGWVTLGNMGKNLVFYWTPGEMLSQGARAYGPTIRLGGIVQTGTLRWDGGKTNLTFRVADDKTLGAPSVLVHAQETPPQMFPEGIGVVVEGTFDRSQTVTSHRLMVNHSNEYRPPKPGEGPRWKSTVSPPTAEAR